MRNTLSIRGASPVDSWYVENCRCPLDRQKFTFANSSLTCARGHEYPVVKGIPILLNFEDLPVFLQEKDLDALIEEACAAPETQDSVDPYVQKAVAGSNGIMYLSLIDRLKEYPIPAIPLPQGNGKRLLDIGCNWGRWSIAAAKLGYEAVGMDPNPVAVFGANRVSKQLGVYNRYVVGDARYLPFEAESFNVVFSYSVLQHFPKEDVKRTLIDVRRVLREGGTCKIQMANRNGLRSLVHQYRRGFREGDNFDVRYWSPSELKRSWSALVGKCRLSVDGFFSLNPQSTEAHLLPLRFRLVVLASDILRTLSKWLPPTKWLADSLYVESKKRKSKDD
jgi:SAM-dependent methyltransferase